MDERVTPDRKHLLAEYFANKVSLYQAVYHSQGNLLQQYWWRPLLYYRLFALAQMGDVRNKQILEIGCGTGHLAISLAKAGAFVEAIDICPQMIKQARINAENAGVADRIHWHVADFDDWQPGHQTSFDYIVAITVFDYAADYQQWLRKAASISQRMIVTLPGKSFLSSIIRRVNLWLFSGHTLNTFSAQQVTELLQQTRLNATTLQKSYNTYCLAVEGAQVSC